jgi:hypothetical protein
MTTLKKTSALFLSIILSDHPHYLCYALDRILLVDANLDLYRFLMMDEKLRRFGDLIVNGSLIQILQILIRRNGVP